MLRSFDHKGKFLILVPFKLVQPFVLLLAWKLDEIMHNTAHFNYYYHYSKQLDITRESKWKRGAPCN